MRRESVIFWTLVFLALMGLFALWELGKARPKKVLAVEILYPIPGTPLPDGESTTVPMLELQFGEPNVGTDTTGSIVIDPNAWRVDAPVGLEGVIFIQPQEPKVAGSGATFIDTIAEPLFLRTIEAQWESFYIQTPSGELEFANIDPNDSESGYQLTDASIRLLCGSGRVCEVMGHQWNVESIDFDHTNAVNLVTVLIRLSELNGVTIRRKCTLCGKTESRQLTEWQE